MRVTRLLAGIAFAWTATTIATLAQTPQQAGVRPAGAELGELQFRAQPLNISKAPPPGTALLAELPECRRVTVIVGRSATGRTANPGEACRGYASSEPASARDGRLAALEWIVETYGGIEPVTLSVSTTQPSLQSLFSLVVGVTDAPGGITRADPDPRDTIDNALARGTPAARKTWRVRFTGMDFTAATPREIVVLLTARDGTGAVKGTDFRLYPYSPRLISATTNHPVPLSASHLTLRLAGLGAATKLTFRSEQTTVENCSWNEVGQDIYVMLGREQVDETPITVGAWSNSFDLTRAGAFISSGGAVPARNCYPRVKVQLEFPREAGASPAILLVAPQPITLQGRALYRIEQTDALRTSLGLFSTTTIAQRLDMGTCSGDSIWPQRYAVGRVNVSGDLSFRIRSGPAGTNCQYSDMRTATNPILLPNGVLLDSSTWSTSGGSTKCRIVTQEALGSGAVDVAASRIPWTEAPSDLHAITGIDNVLVHAGSNVVIHESERLYFRSALRSVSVYLKCDATAFNDHEVRATLEDVTFSAPEGWHGL